MPASAPAPAAARPREPFLVSILIPVFGEVESLRRTVELVEEGCAPWPHEILLLVHRDSGAACHAACRALADASPRVRVHVQVAYPGQGHAYREGFALARGSHFLMMNADLETDPGDAARLIAAAAEGDADLVVASRWMPGGSVDAGYGRGKALLSRAFQNLVATAAGSPLHELTFAFKIGTRALFERFAWQGTGHELALETTLRPILAGFRVIEIPTAWRARSEGRSTHAFRRNLRHARLAARLLAGHFLHGSAPGPGVPHGA